MLTVIGRGMWFANPISVKMGGVALQSCTIPPAYHNRVVCTLPSAFVASPWQPQGTKVEVTIGAGESLETFSTALPRSKSVNFPAGWPRSAAITVNASTTTFANSTTVGVYNDTSYHNFVVTQTNSQSMSLRGSLYLDVAAGFTPQRSTCFEIFTFTHGYTGQFDTISSSIPGSSAQAGCGAGNVFGVKITVPGCETLAPTCSGHGTCDAASGTCSCDEGYSGSACDSVCWYDQATAAFNCECKDALPGSDHLQ